MYKCVFYRKNFTKKYQSKEKVSAGPTFMTDCKVTGSPSLNRWRSLNNGQKGDLPGSVELNQPQTVTLDHLLVEVGGVELDNVVVGWVESLDRQEQGASQHSWRRSGRQKTLLNTVSFLALVWLEEHNTSNEIIQVMRRQCSSMFFKYVGTV